MYMMCIIYYLSGVTDVVVCRIIKVLLDELISRSVEGRSVKVMLRRYIQLACRYCCIIITIIIINIIIIIIFAVVVVLVIVVKIAPVADFLDCITII